MQPQMVTINAIAAAVTIIEYVSNSWSCQKLSSKLANLVAFAVELFNVVLLLPTVELLPELLLTTKFSPYAHRVLQYP